MVYFPHHDLIYFASFMGSSRDASSLFVQHVFVLFLSFDDTSYSEDFSQRKGVYLFIDLQYLKCHYVILVFS